MNVEELLWDPWDVAWGSQGSWRWAEMLTAIGIFFSNPERTWGEAKHLQSPRSLWVLGHCFRVCAAPSACPQPWAGPCSDGLWSDTGNNETEKYNECTFLVGLFPTGLAPLMLQGHGHGVRMEVWCQGWHLLRRATLLLLLKHSHPP